MVSMKSNARRRKAGVPGVVLGLALSAGLAVGCGAASPRRTVASLPGDHASASEQAPYTSAQGDRDMIAFARCMRAHGVQMSDPFHRPGHSGLSVDLPTQDAATRPAYSACNHLMQPIVEAKQRGAAAAITPSVLAALTQYARCMRSRDIGMLDPTPQGALNLGTVAGISGDFGRYSPQFRAADSACRPLLPASVHDDGTGP